MSPVQRMTPKPFVITIPSSVSPTRRPCRPAIGGDDMTLTLRTQKVTETDLNLNPVLPKNEESTPEPSTQYSPSNTTAPHQGINDSMTQTSHSYGATTIIIVHENHGSKLVLGSVHPQS
jgi:hypothetical protein